MSSAQPKAAAIIPAYNEAQTVGDVVRTVASTGIFDEVIVVSDGSTDGTAEAARVAGATLVHQFSWKHGKGAALAHGVAHTDALFVCFFDADLKGLTAEHVRLIVEPVLRGERWMNLGLRDRGPFWTALARRLPLIGGERALRRDIFDLVPEKYLHGFKVESALNYFCRVNGLPYGLVVLPGLLIRRKMEKVGFWRGLAQYLKMYAQVAWAMLEVRLNRAQFRQMAGHMSHHHQ